MLRKEPVVIKSSSGSLIGLKELWRHRELLYFFTWRDIKVKYKQTFFGVLWVLLQPLGFMLIFTLLFSKTLSKANPSSLPYPVFVLSGIVLWNFFYSGVSHAADSMVLNANIIKKVYFPRLLIPLSAIATACVDFSIALLVFLAAVVLSGTPVRLFILFYFPLAMCICLFAAFGLGSLLSALNVKFRDFRYALPFFLQALFFATQIIYSFSTVQNPWLKNLLALNPVNGAIELVRSSLGNETADTNVIFTGAISAVLLLLAGLFYFKKTERYFADIA